MIIKRASRYVEMYWQDYAIILKNGNILNTTLQKDQLNDVFPIVSSILDQLPIQHMYVAPPLYVYRLTENVLVVIFTKLDETTVGAVFDDFTMNFYDDFEEEYKIISSSLRDFVKFSIFSVARKLGPEPFAWTVDSKPISEERIFKYSITSMMLLMDEVKGAQRRVLNFHPYVSEKLLGIIYLFQIPLPDARGGAFDCSLMVAVDYNERALIYQLHYDLEKIFSKIADDMTALFYKEFSDNIEKRITPNLKKSFQTVLIKLIKSFDGVPIKVEPKNIKREMLNSIKSLMDLL